MGETPLAIFCDNLSVHKSRVVSRVYEELDMKPVYNIPYSPEFNPIEAVFSQVKAVYRRERLHYLVNQIPFNQEDAIDRAFSKIKREHCKRCAKKSLNLLFKTS